MRCSHSSGFIVNTSLKLAAAYGNLLFPDVEPNYHFFGDRVAYLHLIVADGRNLFLLALETMFHSSSMRVNNTTCEESLTLWDNIIVISYELQYKSVDYL